MKWALIELLTKTSKVLNTRHMLVVMIAAVGIIEKREKKAGEPKIWNLPCATSGITSTIIPGPDSAMSTFNYTSRALY